jgi:preprotein translocase subunit YajC
MSKRRGQRPMDKSIGFLIGGVFMVVLYFLIALFMVRHDKKQMKSKK